MITIDVTNKLKDGSISKTDIFEVTYPATLMAEVSEDKGVKSLRISGVLLDASINQNKWGVTAEQQKEAVERSGTVGVDIQHESMNGYSTDDWKIVGNADLVYNPILGAVTYSGSIMESAVVEKFASGVWNSKIMGSSPTMAFTHLVCTICGAKMKPYEAGKCGHVKGKTYKGKEAGYWLEGATIKRIGLTSDPAYRVKGGIGGTISEVSFCAQLDKMIEPKVEAIKNKEVGSMTDEDNATVLAKKDKEIGKLTAELEGKTTELAGAEKKLTDLTARTEAEAEIVKKELETARKDLKTTTASYKEVKEKVWTSELSKIISDETLVAEIVKTIDTQEQFTAEKEKLEKIVSASVPEQKGSVATSGKETKDEFKDMFGASAEDYEKELFSRANGE